MRVRGSSRRRRSTALYEPVCLWCVSRPDERALPPSLRGANFPSSSLRLSSVRSRRHKTDGSIAMSDRLFRLTETSAAHEPELVTMVALAVYDRGVSVDRSERFEAQLAGYSVVQARGGSSWQAVRRLVSEHRPLLE